MCSTRGIAAGHDIACDARGGQASFGHRDRRIRRLARKPPVVPTGIDPPREPAKSSEPPSGQAIGLGSRTSNQTTCTSITATGDYSFHAVHISMACFQWRPQRRPVDVVGERQRQTNSPARSTRRSTSSQVKAPPTFLCSRGHFVWAGYAVIPRRTAALRHMVTHLLMCVGTADKLWAADSTSVNPLGPVLPGGDGGSTSS